jgi:hypothetical protein
MVFETAGKIGGAKVFSDTVSMIDQYAYLIIIGAMIYYGFKAIGFGGAVKGAGTGIGKGIAGAYKGIRDKTPGIGREAKENKRLEREERHAETREMSEFIEEKKELRLIEATQSQLLSFEESLRIAKYNGIKGSKQRDGFINSYNDFVTKFGSANSEVKRLLKSTWRASRGLDRLISKLKSAGAKESLIENLRARENKIIERHRVVETSLGIIKSAIDSNKTTIDSIRTLNNPMTLNSFTTKTLDLVKSITKMKSELKNAIEAQKKAYKHSEGLIAKYVNKA